MKAKVKGGYKIKHCKSGKRGYIRATPKPVSEAKADEIHRAIMASKRRAGKAARKSLGKR